MKVLIYLFTIGLLLWVVFNPKGIIKYSTETTNLNRLKKQENKKYKIKKDKDLEYSELNNYIKSISDDQELSIPRPPNLENIEKELMLRGIISKNKNMLRWNKE